MKTASYYNNKSELIHVTISAHAKSRFIQRWPAAYPKEPLPEDINLTICEFFNTSQRIRKLSQHQKTRLKRYGADTLFFKRGILTFVVQDSVLRTVEINKPALRHLNKHFVATPRAKVHQPSVVNTVTPKVVAEPAAYTPTSIKLALRYFPTNKTPKFKSLGSYQLTQHTLPLASLKLTDHFKEFVVTAIQDRNLCALQEIELIGAYRAKDPKFLIFSLTQFAQLIRPLLTSNDNEISGKFTKTSI